jgi:hypothetical protein
MLALQSIYRGEDLFDLIDFRHPMAILDVNPRVAGPRSSENPMTSSLLPRVTEIMLTDPAQILKTNTSWTLPHSGEYFEDAFAHYDITNNTIVKDFE